VDRARWSSGRFAAPTAITDTDGYDTLVLTGSTSRTYTLPSASANAGRRVTFVNQSSAVLTVARAGSDTIGKLSESAITLASTGDTITLQSDGNSAWFFIGEYFQSSTTASTFTFNMGSSSSSVTMVYSRRGDWIDLFVPLVTANTGTGSTQFSSSSGMPAWAQPASLPAFCATNAIRNTYATAGAGILTVDTSTGTVAFRRDAANTAWSNSVTGGLSQNGYCRYYVGSGS
jgi:hypothetical protein